MFCGCGRVSGRRVHGNGYGYNTSEIQCLPGLQLYVQQLHFEFGVDCTLRSGAVFHSSFHFLFHYPIAAIDVITIYNGIILASTSPPTCA